MSTLEAVTLDQVVDTARYPLSEPESAEGQAVVSRARRELLTEPHEGLTPSMLPRPSP